MKYLDNCETTDCEYNARISSLPSRTIAIKVANTNLAQAYEYQGFWFLKEALRGLMWAQDHFIPLPASTLIASYPKTGTTWLKALSFSIATRNKYDLSSNPLQTASPHECVPFLEYAIPKNPSHKYYPEIPLFSTHAPYTTLPESIISSDCKIVYICRDPTDAFVSWWLFAKKMTPPQVLEFVPIEEGFQQFCEGYSFYGPYWEHILGYWRASLQRPGTILFLKYEDLKINTVSNVKKLAEFLGYPFSVEEERDGVVERLVDSCSFEHMSSLEVNKSGVHNDGSNSNLLNSVFFRKAKAGDWKNHVPAEMKEQMDQIMELKLKDSGLIWGKTSDT